MRVIVASVLAIMAVMPGAVTAQTTTMPLGLFINTCKSLKDSSISVELESLILFASCSGFFEGVVSHFAINSPEKCPLVLSMADKAEIYTRAVKSWEKLQASINKGDAELIPELENPAQIIITFIKQRSNFC